MKLLGNIIWMIEIGSAVPVAVWQKGDSQAHERLPEHGDELDLVFRGRHLDCSHPLVFRPAVLHHHHRGPVRQAAHEDGSHRPHALRPHNY